MLRKVRMILKNALNKNCSELNFLQKTQWTQISTSSRSGARGLHRLSFLKYYNVLESESRFTLGLKAAKNADYIKKMLQTKII